MSKLYRAKLRKSVLVLCSFCMISTSTYGQEKEWWFEVEVILFKHNRDANLLSESFAERNDTEHQNRLRQKEVVDLISLYLRPDISVIKGALANCSDLNKPTTEHSVDFLNLDPVLLDPNIATSAIRVDIVESVEDPSTGIATRSLDNPQVDTQAINGSAEETEESAVRDTYIVSVLSPEPSELASLDSSIATGAEYISQTDIDSFESKAKELTDEFVNSDDIQLQSEDAPLPPSFAYQFYEIHMADFDIKSIEIPTQFHCVIPEPMFELAKSSKTEVPIVEIVTEVPVNIDGTERLYQDDPYLMAEKSLELAELRTRIKRKRDVQPILHLGWRQEVLFDEENSKPVRLFAGQNYADEFDASHMPLQEQVETPYVDPYPVVLKIEPQDQVPTSLDGTKEIPSPQDDLIQKIRNALANPEFVVAPSSVDEQETFQQQLKTNELWQLDGNFKIFLKYIQGTPYLHIDSEFDFRAPVFNAELTSEQSTQQIDTFSGEKSNNYLQNFHFKQLRRIISKQIHYFDHPLFGMIVQVRRHDRPTPEDLTDDSQIENEQQ